MKDDIIPSVGVLVIHDDAVLLVRHGEHAGHLTGVYGIPGGRSKEGEAEKQTAVRELFEETGLSTTEDCLYTYDHNIYIADIPRKDGTVKRFSMKVLLCKRYHGFLKATYETAPQWIAIAELRKYPLLPNVQKMIQDGKTYL